METPVEQTDSEARPSNLHHIGAEKLEHAYTLLHKGGVPLEEVRESLVKGEACILYDVDGVLTDSKIREVALLSLYPSRLSTVKSIIHTFPLAGHFVYTSRPESTRRFRDWITPLRQTLSALPRTSPRHVEIISFTPEKVEAGNAISQLKSVLSRKENIFAIITDLAKEGSTKFLARVMGTRSKATRDVDTLIPMFETIADKYEMLVVLDNDDTILEQITQFARQNPKKQIYYISIPTNSYLVRMRGLKQRVDKKVAEWRESRTNEE